MLKLLFLALDPVEHERAQAQIAHEHDESDEPSADHFIACWSDQIIAPETNTVCDLHNTEERVDTAESPSPEDIKILRKVCVRKIAPIMIIIVITIEVYGRSKESKTK